tara:strand:- start:31 stop:429 length:399 start_codon:yes stop_codon:yes gene_type:complete
MSIDYKKENSYKTIGEVAEKIGLKDSKTGKLQTHTIRYWETRFKEIKPTIGAGKRRYYSKENFDLINSIQYLLKQKGLTINGVKRLLKDKGIHKLDQDINLGVYKPTLKNKENIKKRLKRITKIISDLKSIK